MLSAFSSPIAVDRRKAGAISPIYEPIMGRAVALGFHPAVSYSGRFIRPPILNSATAASAASGGCSASSITAATGDACANDAAYALALRLYVALIRPPRDRACHVQQPPKANARARLRIHRRVLRDRSSLSRIVADSPLYVPGFVQQTHPHSRAYFNHRGVGREIAV